MKCYVRYLGNGIYLKVEKFKIIMLKFLIEPLSENVVQLRQLIHYVSQYHSIQDKDTQITSKVEACVG